MSGNVPGAGDTTVKSSYPPGPSSLCEERDQTRSHTNKYPIIDCGNHPMRGSMWIEKSPLRKWLMFVLSLGESGRSTR